MGDLIEECESAGKITLARFRDLMGISRRPAQLILERFDADGLTRRVGDERLLGRSARGILGADGVSENTKLVKEAPTAARLLMIAVLALTLVATALAQAATPVRIGPGVAPGLAVDVAGTAYIAWDGPEYPSSLQFCRLPRGATTCDVRHAITAPGATTTRAFLAVSGSRVVVVQYRYPLTNGDPPAAVWAFTSTNGGVSFDSGRTVGILPFFDAVFGPGDTLSGVTDSQTIAGGAFQNVPLNGGTSGTTYAQLSGDHPYQGTVGLLDATTPLAVFTTGSDAALFRRYDGSGGLNDAANWTPAVDLGVARKPRLAGGPSGLFLLAVAPDNTVFARKWNGTTFGPPATVAAGANAASLAAFEDAAGRLHAVFERADANGLHLIHAISDDGTTWRSGTAATQVLGDGGFGDARVATAPDHIGVAVWADGPPGPREIRVVAVGPGAPVGPAPRLPRKPPATARRLRSGKVELIVQGTLALPAGVSKAQGCNGKLTLTGTRIAKRNLRLSKTCGYRTTVTFAGKIKRLTITLSFPGNASLGPVKRSYKIRIRQR